MELHGGQGAEPRPEDKRSGSEGLQPEPTGAGRVPIRRREDRFGRTRGRSGARCAAQTGRTSPVGVRTVGYGPCSDRRTRIPDGRAARVVDLERRGPARACYAAGITKETRR